MIVIEFVCTIQKMDTQDFHQWLIHVQREHYIKLTLYNRYIIDKNIYVKLSTEKYEI